MPSVSVADLVRRAQRGDVESFSELVRRFQLREEVRSLPDALRTAVVLFYAGEQ